MCKAAALVVALCGLIGAVPVQAAGGGRHGPPSDYRAQPADRKGGERGGGHEEREQHVSLDDAVAIVRARYEGKVIRAETQGSADHPVHYVRILSPEGRVYTVKVDGVSGRIQ